jgi:phenol 2-monooxygenase
MLNQGAVEQVFVDHLHNKNVRVERHKAAESLHISPIADDNTQQFPVVVGVRDIGNNGM